MENKKKILYLITQSELGGAQRYVFDLANSLKGEYEVEVAFGPLPAGQGESGGLADWLRKAGIKYYILPHLKRSISPVSDIIATFEIVKLIRQTKPDFIHLNSSKISILGSFAVFILKILDTKYIIHNTIYTVHGWVFNEPLPSWQKSFYLFAEKFTARFKDKFICVSEFDRQQTLKYKIAPENKLVTIHNGINTIDFLSRDEARQKFSVMLERPAGWRGAIASRDSIASPMRSSRMTIGSIGNLYKTKGYEYLIKTGKILKDKKIDFKIIMVGEGQEKENLLKLTDELGMNDTIIFTGRIENAASLFLAFDIYVNSSVKEGLSYTIIQAMQAGLPIVATKVGGSPELITDNKEGLLVEAQNPEALAAAIIKLTDDKNLAEQLGLAARQKALTQFTLTQMIEATKKLYS